MHLQFVGCGDAFGSGGRANTCFHVVGEQANFLIDCGATSAVALKRLGIQANTIDTILVTHFHGDHFGGIPFLMLEAQMNGRRERPLTIAGPPGLADRYARAMDVAFPGSPQQPKRFSLTLQELAIGQTTPVDALKVTPFPMVHVEAAGPCTGLRIECEGKIIAYSGDTEWTESLVALGRDADLLICECYTFDKKVKSHTDYTTLSANIERIAPKRLVLTHMSDDMLAHRGNVPYETAAEGMVLRI
ncbi:MAG: MBL fold metallo-hydrolase [Variibacter sp.]